MASLTALVKEYAALPGGHRAAVLPETEAELWKRMEFVPRAIQYASLRSEKRFSVEVWHRRAGKTVQKIIKLITRAMFCPFPSGRYAFLAPTYSQAEDIAWAYLLRYTEVFEGIGRQVHIGRLSVTIPNVNGTTSRIRLYGVDNQNQRLRGGYLDGLVADEWQHIPMTVWSEQVRPMLTDIGRRGKDCLGRPNQWADFIGTPLGRNQLYKMYVRAKRWSEGAAVSEFDPEANKYVQVRSNEWFAALWKASETKLVSPEELAAARNDMGESRFMQEFECSFDAIVEGSIFGPTLTAIRKHGHVGVVPISPLHPVHTAWDLGFDDATAIWFYQVVSRKIHMIDYLEVTHSSLGNTVALLAEKGYKYGTHHLPHDVAVRELGTGKSRFAILQEHGLRASPVAKTNKWEQLAAAQALLEKIYFDEDKCADGLDKLALYRRELDDRLGVMREKPRHGPESHAADALQTMAIGIRMAQLTLGEDDRPSHSIF